MEQMAKTLIEVAKATAGPSPLLECIKALVLEYMKESHQPTMTIEVHACLKKQDVQMIHVTTNKNRLA